MILPITLTPVPTATATTLPMPDSTVRDLTGNVTWEFGEYLTDLPGNLPALCSRNVEQFRTRLGTFVCVADGDAKLWAATWDEVDPFTGATRARSQRGVLVLGGDRFERRAMSVSLVLYRCDKLYQRGTGLVIE